MLKAYINQQLVSDNLVDFSENLSGDGSLRLRLLCNAPTGINATTTMLSFLSTLIVPKENENLDIEIFDDNDQSILHTQEYTNISTARVYYGSPDGEADQENDALLFLVWCEKEAITNNE